MLKSIPPFEDVFNMAGMKLPEYLGAKSSTDENKAQPVEPSETVVSK